MTRPLVSIAIATWNGERYLREQLDTVYAQTWKPLEVVVSDDASTDGTVSILQEYSRSHGLRYQVNQQRLGLVNNFERAIALTSGDFIALCDQDDLWKPHKVATLIDSIGNATLVYCNVGEIIDVDGHRRHEDKWEPIFHFARAHGSGHPTRYLIAENWVVSHSVLFRRGLIAHALPIPEHQWFHDGWLALVASKLEGVIYVDEQLQTYRQHSESFTFAPRSQSSSWSALLRFLDGSFRANWTNRCASESKRISDVMELSLLDADDRDFAMELLCYYQSGLEGGHRWRSFRSGASVSKYFVTQQSFAARCRLALKGLLASASASLE